MYSGAYGDPKICREILKTWLYCTFDINVYVICRYYELVKCSNMDRSSSSNMTWNQSCGIKHRLSWNLNCYSFFYNNVLMCTDDMIPLPLPWFWIGKGKTYYQGKTEDSQGSLPVVLKLCQSYTNLPTTSKMSTVKVIFNMFIGLIGNSTPLLHTLPKAMVLIWNKERYIKHIYTPLFCTASNVE